MAAFHRASGMGHLAPLEYAATTCYGCSNKKLNFREE